MGAEYFFYMKSIETHARAFLPLNISAVGSVETIKYTQLYKIGSYQLCDFLMMMKSQHVFHTIQIRGLGTLEIKHDMKNCQKH